MANNKFDKIKICVLVFDNSFRVLLKQHELRKKNELNWIEEKENKNHISSRLVFGRTKKQEKEKEIEKKRESLQRVSMIVRVEHSAIPWSAISTAKRVFFCVKFWGNTLLDTKNIHTVSDFVFNSWIVRSMVERLNPKTFINVFLFKKNYQSRQWKLNREYLWYEKYYWVI